MKIGIETLAVGYERKRVIDGLSLEIDSGTVFTLLGPSGCGKTTLLRAIAGFVDIDDGRLMFGAKDVTRQPAYKRNIGMVFQ
ncbi:ATP-binding cassette domain-containing protein, partial [Acinetobacter baumannii]